MPIPPDDYVWSEPVDRPLKRYRYSDETVLMSNMNTASGGAPLYASGTDVSSAGGGEASPHAQVASGGGWPAHAHSHRHGRTTSFSRMQPPRLNTQEIQLTPSSMSANQQWSAHPHPHPHSGHQISTPISINFSDPNPMNHPPHSAGGVAPMQSYTVYEQLPSSSPTHSTIPVVNMSGPYASMHNQLWQSYQPPQSDPSNRGQ